MSKCAIAHRPSYNRKVPCECGRGEKSKNAVACRMCGVEKHQASFAAKRAGHDNNKHREPVRASLDKAMARDWLSRPMV